MKYHLICRNTDSREWNEVSNPKFQPGFTEFSAVQILMSNPEFIDYAEYSSCKVVYRIVKAKDLAHYI
jgi:hypothetical protein